MFDFEYYAPTKVEFGKNSLATLPALLREQGAKQVLIHYGGGSAERSGLLDKVRAAAKDKPVEAIDMMAYGMMDGAKVLQQIKGMM